MHYLAFSLDNDCAGSSHIGQQQCTEVVDDPGLIAACTQACRNESAGCARSDSVTPAAARLHPSSPVTQGVKVDGAVTPLQRAEGADCVDWDHEDDPDYVPLQHSSTKGGPEQECSLSKGLNAAFSRGLQHLEHRLRVIAQVA